MRGERSLVKREVKTGRSVRQYRFTIFMRGERSLVKREVKTGRAVRQYRFTDEI